MRLTGHARLSWYIIGIAVLAAGVVLATRAASAQSSPAVSGLPVAAAPSPGGHLAGAGRMTASSISPATSYPVWCCSAGNPLGLAVTGQATVRGAGPAARASALAKAVADAVGQARSAASAAGISLGRIINMQVSAPYYPYPLPLGAASGRAGSAPSVGGAPATPGGRGSAVPCPGGCPGYPGVSTYATVTITWAIA